jgi:LysR family transcriptional regulator, cyn operon transcriptional activator
VNLQQLRYLVATADEGTMTRAAETLHVAQPALSRAVRALESELGVTVFERKGRGVRVTRQGRDVIAIARRILADVDRLATIAATETLRVCAIAGQAREIGSPTVARYVALGRGRVALDTVDANDDVIRSVRDSRAQLGLTELPAPTDLTAVSLGWQEIVLVYPRDWDLPDPIEMADLSGLPLLSPTSDNWRHETMDRHLSAAGIEANIAAETSERDVLLGLVQQGVGAWFTYGRQAQAAVAGGAGLVHLTPAPVREVGIVHLGDLDASAREFIDLATAEAKQLLIPVGDPRLADATWVSGGVALGTAPPSSSVAPGATPAQP